ncbi:hypothetical protein SAMN02799624_05324 [Paenibacillus sp. UNC496MF]|uniref:hypothetical protein n=1 Tax=Paenibacillus sp. UNC496MF TaxID=1502753 RepID=UPI0008E8BE33|nr:hypothetical protein [Paenibacillus sp. UNC496MF]SFJ64162.1 hypothetical protein SAMN02799624_05324 [Paenibacillus sp. UNC496MF]
MNIAIQRAIFATNAFADAFPEKHVELWKRFVNEVPPNKRGGVYGAENKAYIKWLTEIREPHFVMFAQEHIGTMEKGQ